MEAIATSVTRNELLVAREVPSRNKPSILDPIHLRFGHQVGNAVPAADLGEKLDAC